MILDATIDSDVRPGEIGARIPGAARRCDRGGRRGPLSDVGGSYLDARDESPGQTQGYAMMPPTVMGRLDASWLVSRFRVWVGDGCRSPATPSGVERLCSECLTCEAA